MLAILIAIFLIALSPIEVLAYNGFNYTGQEVRIKESTEQTSLDDILDILNQQRNVSKPSLNNLLENKPNPKPLPNIPVNPDITYQEPNNAGPISPPSKPSPPISADEETLRDYIWHYLKNNCELNMTDLQIAAVMGNIKQESRFRPDALNANGGAFGLIQWLGGRKANLMQFAQANGVSPEDMDIQLRFHAQEMRGAERVGFQNFITISTRTNSLFDSTIAYHDQIERSGDTDNILRQRANFSAEVYKAYIDPSHTPETRATVTRYKYTGRLID